MKIHIRPAIADDASQACEVIRASIRVCCVQDHCNDPKIVEAWLHHKTPAFIQKLILSANGHAVVAEQDDGQVIGFAMSSGASKVMLCYAAPAARFKGVGRAMLADLERHAVQTGASTLQLESTRTALGFYLRNGFVPEGQPIQAFGMEGQPMRKTLFKPSV